MMKNVDEHLAFAANEIAQVAGGWFTGAARDYGRISLYAVPAAGHTLAEVEAAIDEVLRDVRVNGITEAELARAKKVYLSEHVYESDSQSTLARRYGYGLVIGQSIAEIEKWPERIEKVTLADVAAAAKKHLDIRRSVTGLLIPEEFDGADIAAASSGKADSEQAAHK